MRISQARILDWVAISFSRVLSDPGLKPGSPALQVVSFLADRFFLLAEPPDKPTMTSSEVITAATVLFPEKVTF